MEVRGWIDWATPITWANRFICNFKEHSALNHKPPGASGTLLLTHWGPLALEHMPQARTQCGLIYMSLPSVQTCREICFLFAFLRTAVHREIRNYLSLSSSNFIFCPWIFWLFKCRFWSSGSSMGLKVCISNKLPWWGEGWPSMSHTLHSKFLICFSLHHHFLPRRPFLLTHPLRFCSNVTSKPLESSSFFQWEEISCYVCFSVLLITLMPSLSWHS